LEEKQTGAGQTALGSNQLEGLNTPGQSCLLAQKLLLVCCRKHTVFNGMLLT
jgi:hypothetical protein